MDKELIKKAVWCRLGDDRGLIFKSNIMDTMIDTAIAMVGNGSDKLVIQQTLVMCLGRQALISKGQEMTTNDNGVNFTPPKVSKMCYDQYIEESSVLRDMIMA
ncbi:MAG TPA: hypothetical protein VMX17_17000 [Candidatus Glassbacteria bacterium]|nr:hypothetical protein [Candidatus Glassbacteria bacterium]